MKLTVQMATALNYLHNTMNVAHNDIKPDNIFAHSYINTTDHTNQNNSANFFA
jgi:serine/threonine protein kinase